MANKVPASFTPRRLASVSRITSPIERATRCSASAGTAEVIATEPATTDTATVRM
jgi:hypothetical protein